ncbi:hypothetical protein HID58_064237 [Brassica napus]|uniref:non-specific serine/threonine protein kinase n=1 Tax=Brassica napus TaxID=3708 RepID=A0ABQ7Z9I6_BRANA|nr:hypothetical protein HID58_064237 [Brassica napus]
MYIAKFVVLKTERQSRMGATLNGLLFYVCATFSIIHLAHSQNQQGFISLDCGLPSNESPYNEPFTNLTYISDASFGHSGKTGTIHKDLKTHFMKPYTGLRYFPNGIRNCYNLSVMQDTKYLIRTVFVYGNYDGLNASPIFDLYLGPNIWTTVDAKLSGLGMAQEIIHITRSNILEICVRYPEDVYDRAWSPFLPVEWTQINTTLNVVDSHKDYNPPQDVIKTAAVPANASEPMTFSWTLDTSDDETYAYLYMADIQKVRNNDTREFDIIANGKVEFDPYSPMKFEVEVLFNRVPLKCEGGLCRVQLSRTRKSTLPPLMNALEIFQVIEFPQSETNQDDVIAMKNIRETYGLNKISWQGDPCVPKQFLWSGLRCNVIDVSTPPRIIALDLSRNNLTGEVPEFLAKMKSLVVINLSGNKLRGRIPQALLDREKEGLKLSLDGYLRTCKSCKKKFPVAAVGGASLSSVAIIITVVVLIFIFKRKKPSISKEVKDMTNNFQVVLGKGGFGVVCQGFLNNQQVAVKVLSQSSTQGYKEFKTEVELLLRVHHVNLVNLIGYCDEGNDLALIYEFMENGNLKEHLSGERDGSVLNWPSRLKIAIESALGIEYLQIGCKPPMVHRDVKSTNILLGQHFEAKLADFGLSRSFLVGSKTHVSTTNVAGTIGYLDPEYYQKHWLTEKSDVYSFGIVLLEIITGQPVIDQSRENSYIVEWAKSMLANGDIESITDPKLHREYDTGSSWKALELAMACINPSSAQRPNMTRVAHELNECLEVYENLSKRRSQDANSSKSTGHSISFVSDTPSAR